MKSFFITWQFWALLSAFFAALTAIFAKVGITNINSDFATFIRTIVILAFVAVLLTASNGWQSLTTISAKTYIFLALSGAATGASWLCYFRAMKIGQVSQVAPLDKLSIVLIAVFGVVLLGEQLSIIGWFAISLITIGAALLAFTL